MAEAATNEQTLDENTLAASVLHQCGVCHTFKVVGILVSSLATVSVSLGVHFLAFHNEQSVGYATSTFGYLTDLLGVLLTVSSLGCGLSNA